MLNVKKISPYLLVAPALIFLIIFLVYPMINTIWLSFWNCSYFEPEAKTFAGLKNYIALFHEEGFKSSLSFTICFTLVCISLEFIIGMCLALILNIVTRFGTLVRTVLILPYMVASIATGQIWRLIFSFDYGMANYILNASSISTVNWLGSNGGAFWALVIAQVWKSTPFVMLVLLSGLQSIPEEVHEAGVVDGANAWQSFWRITFPLLLPAVTIVLVFETIFKLRVFDLIITLTGGGPGKVTTPLGVLLQRNYFQSYEAGFSGAISVVLLSLGAAFSFLYFFLINRQSKKGGK